MPVMAASRLKELESIGIDVVRELAILGMDYFNSTLREERKADRSLVSEADRGIETRCRELLAKVTPEFGFVGEEFGSLARLDGGKGVLSLGEDTYWMLDPIDGTINFLSRSPLWTTLLALIHRGEPVLGIVSLPPLDEVFVASRGNGARRGALRSGIPAIPCAVRTPRALAEAHLSTTSPTGFAFRAADAWFLALLGRPGETRTHSDAYGFTRILCGGIDAMVDPIVAHYDVAALQVLFDETPGACFTTLHGDRGPFRYRCGSALAASSPTLAQELLDSYRRTLHAARAPARVETPLRRERFISDFRMAPETIPFTEAQPPSQQWVRALEEVLADWRLSHPDSLSAPFVRLRFECHTHRSFEIRDGVIGAILERERCDLSADVTGQSVQNSFQATIRERLHPEDFLHAALAGVGAIRFPGSLAENLLLDAVSGAFPLSHAWPYGIAVDVSGLEEAGRRCAIRQGKSVGKWSTSVGIEIRDEYELTRIAGQRSGTKVRVHCEVLRDDVPVPGLRVTRSVEPGTLAEAWEELVATHAHLMAQIEEITPVENP